MDSCQLNDLVGEFLETVQNPNTHRAYRNDLNKMLRFFDDRKISCPTLVRSSVLSNFMADLLKRYRPAYVIHIKASVSSFFEYLYATERITRNPAVIFSTIRVRPPHRFPRALSAIQRTLLISGLKYTTYCELRTSVAVLLGLHQGLRVSEITKLRWDAVDFEKNTLRLIRKGNKEQIMPMTRTMSAALHRLKEEMIVKFGLFPKCFVLPRPSRDPNNDLGVNASTVQKLVKRAAEQAQLKGHISVHVLRHSFATHLIESGIDILTVSYLMGHASIRTTQVYVRENPGRTAEALKMAFQE